MQERPNIPRLFVPALLEFGLVALIGFGNTAIMASIGTFALAAVTLCDSVANLVMAVFGVLPTGITVRIGQAMGQGDLSDARDMSEQFLFFAVLAITPFALILGVFARPLLGLMFASATPETLDAAATYLHFSAASMPFMMLFYAVVGIYRGLGNFRAPFLMSLVLNASFTGLNFLFISGLHWGTLGLGVALLACRAVCAIWVYARTRSNRSPLRLTRFFCRLQMKFLAPVLQNGVPYLIDTLLLYIGALVQTTFLSGLGADAMSANMIANTIATFLAVPVSAMSLVVVTCAAYHFGAGDYREAKRGFFRSLGLTILMFGALAGGAALLLNPLLGLFPQTAESAAIARRLLLLLCATYPILSSASSLGANFLRGVGDARYSMWSSILCTWVARVALSWLFGLHLGYGMFGIWMALVLEHVARILLLYPRILRGTWARS